MSDPTIIDVSLSWLLRQPLTQAEREALARGEAVERLPARPDACYRIIDDRKTAKPKA